MVSYLHLSRYETHCHGLHRSMNDDDGPRISATVYKELLTSEYLDMDVIPYALDDAVQKLRQMGAPPHRWAPYIHMGV